MKVHLGPKAEQWYRRHRLRSRLEVQAFPDASGLIPDSPELSCLMPQNEENQTRGWCLCFSTWANYRRADSLGFQSQRKTEPHGQREVWDLIGKGSQGRIICTETALYQLQPPTPSRPTETMPWAGPSREGWRLHFFLRLLLLSQACEVFSIWNGLIISFSNEEGVN